MEPFRSGRGHRAAWAAWLLLCSATAVGAQSTAGTLFGTVLDGQGRPIAGATISVESIATAQRRAVTSDAAGGFSILGLTPGSYELRIEAQGFEMDRRAITVTVAVELRLIAVLQPATLRERVSVTASASVIEASRTTLGQTIVRDEIERLPVAARDFASLAMLTPGILPNLAGNLNASSGIVTSGQTGRSNTFLLDGASLDDPFQANPRGGVPLDAVREFAVFTDGYAAQYGHTSGAIVSAVSRSGSNRYTGSASYLVRDDRLDATSPAIRLVFSGTLKEVRFEQKIAAGSGGGPIRRDRAFFFGALETALVDSASITTSPLLFTYRPFASAVNPWHSARWQGFGRVDEALGRHQLTTQYRLDRLSGPGDSGGGNQAPETRNDGVLSDQEITVTGRRTGTAQQNEFQLQVGRRSWGFDRGDHCVWPCPSFSERRNSIILGAAPSDGIRTRETYWQLRDAFTSIREGPFGEHRLTVGLNAMLIKGWFGGAANQNGTFTFETDMPFDSAQPSTYPVRYTQTIGSPDVELGHTLVGLFAQDSWTPTATLTINAGVRWDHDSLRGIWQDWNNVAPRLGVAFTPSQSAATVLRASYGIYFDQTFEVIVRQFRQAEQTSQRFVTNPGYPNWGGINPNGGSVISERQPNARRLVDLETPYAHRATAGVQRSFGAFTASMDGVWAYGCHLLETFDANVPDPSGTRPDPRFQIVRVVQSTGHSWYRGIAAGLTKRYAEGYSLSVAYTLSSAERDTEEFDFTPQDQRKPADERGAATSDVRHQLVGSGTVDLPFGAQLGLVITTRSGAPYNVITGRDDNRDGTANDRPPGVARNSARGAGFFQLDLRLSKSFRLARAKLELTAEAFNLTNHANWFGYNGNQLSQTFGMPTAAGIARQVQLAAHVRF